MRFCLKRLGWIAVLWSLSMTVWAAPQAASKSPQPQCFMVVGTASTEGVDEPFARQMAIRNGLKFASLHSNVSVASDQTVSDFQMGREATRFTSHSKIQSYTVVDEGLESRYDQYGEKLEGAPSYRVKMRVCLTEDAKACENVPGLYFQSRLAVAPVVVANSYEARDISNLIQGYQTELERRLRDQGQQNFTMLNFQVGVDESSPIRPNLSNTVLDPVRDRSGAQYMLLTVLRSLSMQEEEKPYLNQVRRFYNLDVRPDTRYLEVDWYLVDLMNRNIVHQQRAGFDVKGDVLVGRDRPFGSNAFFATDTGTAFHAILHQQVTDVVSFLKCQPLETQVIDVRNGEYMIYLNERSGVKEGDQLAVYHRVGRGVQFQGVDLGSDETPSAFLKIKRILPRFAVGELVAQKGTVQVGDRVRSW